MEISPVLSTERLLLRPLKLSDRAAYLSFLTQPEVTRFLGSGQDKTPQEAEAILRDFCQQWEEHPRWGVWAVCTPDGQLAGHCGFLPLDGGPVELLYALAPAFWNQGLGTEAALAVLNYAAGQRLWPQVDALVYPQNRPSARILIKLGFVPLAQETHFGARLDRYRRPLAGL